MNDRRPQRISATLYAALARAVESGSKLYALLDAAQDPMLPRRAADAGLPVESLYAGRLGGMLDDVAPHLVSLDPRGEVTGALIERCSEHLGVILQTTASFEPLRKHLRKFLMVKDQAGKKYRFRFYDPRVLRAFLPVCSAEEVNRFFGPVQRFYTAARDGEGVLAFAAGCGGVLSVSSIALPMTAHVLPSPRR